MELKICHLYPDVMNLSGDRGNVICMEKRLAWRGIDVCVQSVAIGDVLHAADHDLYFIGNGQPFDQKVLLEDLKKGNAAQIKAAAEDGIPFLAICGGYQLLGDSYEDTKGCVTEGIGVLSVQTKCAEKRLVGDYVFESDLISVPVVGFENHAGRTILSGQVQPLGRTTVGHGNNGEDGTEGAQYKNVFASYAHGCLLPKNLQLCDLILKTALERKYGAVDLMPLDDKMENGAHDYMVNRLSK